QSNSCNSAVRSLT
ncbi:hypothetical protein D039_2975B, partial [Vibrio parahaemolyticus EKP-028]